MDGNDLGRAYPAGSGIPGVTLFNANNFEALRT